MSADPAGPAVPTQGVGDTGLRRLLVVATGSLSAADLPVWLDWTRTCHPEVELRVVLTRSARQFLAPAAVSLRLGRPVEFDEWDETDLQATHVQWQQWAQAILVYPATFSFVARFATGMADTPAMLAAQCTGAPVVLAPSLPPGGLQSPAFARHWAELRSRPRVGLAAPRPGRSATTGEADAWVPAPWIEAYELVERCLAEDVPPHLADALPGRVPEPDDRPSFPTLLGVPR